MTDTEQKEICRIAHIDDINDLSDGYHTFRQLYYQRMMLFAALVKQNRDKAWKSLRHSDGELCFGGGWFIVGIDTPEGSYTYHYEDNFFSLFDCEELEKGKVWDGHTEKDVTRLLSLKQESCDDAISRQAILNKIKQVCFSKEWIQFRVDKGSNGQRDFLINYIKQLPSATAQPKTGHWNRVTDNAGYWVWECDKCGWQQRFNTNYCPNCGAKMQEEEENDT